MANILVVDDSKFMRKMLSDILTKEEHRILAEAENGKEAVELYKQLQPDVVTMDIIMPEVGGVDAISALKAIVRENPQARVVMVSAMGQEKVVEECIHAGASDFIIKPFQPSDIAGTVKAVLKGA